jgi:hypothetical protein
LKGDRLWADLGGSTLRGYESGGRRTEKGSEVRINKSNEESDPEPFACDFVRGRD